MSEFDQGRRFLRVVRHGFLNEDVFAQLQKLAGDIEVGRGRGDDADRVTDLGEFVNRREAIAPVFRCDGASRFGVGITDSPKLHRPSFAKVGVEPSMMPTQGADTDNAHVQILSCACNRIGHGGDCSDAAIRAEGKPDAPGPTSVQLPPRQRGRKSIHRYRRGYLPCERRADPDARRASHGKDRRNRSWRGPCIQAQQEGCTSVRSW